MVRRLGKEVLEQGTHHAQPQVLEGECCAMEKLHNVQATLQPLHPHHLRDSEST